MLPRLSRSFRALSYKVRSLFATARTIKAPEKKKVVRVSLVALGATLGAALAIAAGFTLAQVLNVKDHTEKANETMRAMERDLLDAQRKQIEAFKALPEAGEIRQNIGSGFNTWSISEQALPKVKTELDHKIAAIRDVSEGDDLVKGYKGMIGGLIKGTEEEIPFKEDRLNTLQIELEQDCLIQMDGNTEPLDAGGRKLISSISQVLELDLELAHTTHQILSTYEIKLNLLD